MNEENNKEKTDFTGYPSYLVGEDIYNKYKEEQDIDPENASKNKEPIKMMKRKKITRRL